MTAKINNCQKVIFIKPRHFDTADILSVLQYMNKEEGLLIRGRDRGKETEQEIERCKKTDTG